MLPHCCIREHFFSASNVLLQFAPVISIHVEVHGRCRNPMQARLLQLASWSRAAESRADDSRHRPRNRCCMPRTRGSLCFAFGSGTADHRLSEQTKREETERQYIRLGGVRNPLCWATGASCIHALMPWPPSAAKPVDSADMLACHTNQTRVNQYHTSKAGSRRPHTFTSYSGSTRSLFGMPAFVRQCHIQQIYLS